MIRTHLPRPSEIDGLLLHIKGLVYVRALLEENGASQAEIAEHTAELERQREHLAELVQAAAKSRQTLELPSRRPNLGREDLGSSHLAFRRF
jgi:hypothetical protein